MVLNIVSGCVALAAIVLLYFSNKSLRAEVKRTYEMLDEAQRAINRSTIKLNRSTIKLNACRDEITWRGHQIGQLEKLLKEREYELVELKTVSKGSVKSANGKKKQD